MGLWSAEEVAVRGEAGRELSCGCAGQVCPCQGSPHPWWASLPPRVGSAPVGEPGSLRTHFWEAPGSPRASVAVNSVLALVVETSLSALPWQTGPGMDGKPSVLPFAECPFRLPQEGRRGAQA